MTKYPVVKMKELRNYKIGDVVHLKKNGKLVEIAKYASYTGSCKRCVFWDQCRYGGELDYKTGWIAGTVKVGSRDTCHWVASWVSRGLDEVKLEDLMTRVDPMLTALLVGMRIVG